MGANSTSMSELASNEYLKRLAGKEPINFMDPFWNQLLSFSFPIPITSADAKLLEESTASVCKSLSINNCKTGNFRALLQNFLMRSAELKASAQCEDNIFTWQTYNALFIVRSICKYFVEHFSEELVIQQFEVQPLKETELSSESNPDVDKEDENRPLAEELINTLIEIIVDVPVVSFTYALHVESLNTLLVLLSIQMYQPMQATKFTVFKYIMAGKCTINACLLMKALLKNYQQQEKCPSELYKQGGDAGSMLYQMTSTVASSLWSVMTLGMGNKQKKSEEEFSETLLANQSLLLILVLTSHCTNDRTIHNPYRQALFSFTNSQDQSSNSSPTKVAATFKIDFTQLYTALCDTLTNDQTTLLLYLLIHRNTQMKAFVLSRTGVDHLIMPLLKILYHAQESNSHHIYMALIILLILSEDDVFSRSVHEIVLKNVVWFKERAVSEVTLGGLLILVVIRTIQFNIARMRDKYLHTNCLAALANMSGQFSNLHPYVAQRIVSLFSQLCKKHSKLIEEIRLAAMEGGEKEGDDTQEDYIQDLAVLEEVIRMVLEIINSCLANNLHHNPNLLYTLLYKKELFLQFRTHPTFQDIIQNIDTVLSFFSARLEKNGTDLSPNEVLDVITQGARQFRRDNLRKFPDLKFKYVEEESPEEFFIPYIWSLVYHSSNMYFNPSRIALFSLSS